MYPWNGKEKEKGRIVTGTASWIYMPCVTTFIQYKYYLPLFALLRTVFFHVIIYYFIGTHISLCYIIIWEGYNVYSSRHVFGHNINPIYCDTSITCIPDVFTYVYVAGLQILWRCGPEFSQGSQSHLLLLPGSSSVHRQPNSLPHWLQ